MAPTLMSLLRLRMRPNCVMADATTTVQMINSPSPWPLEMPIMTDSEIARTKATSR